MKLGAFISDLSNHAARWAGRPMALGLAVASCVVWGGLGPVFGYTAGWMLVINTGTTIVSFIMLFLVQGSQIRGDAAIQIKLDELIAVNTDARNQLIALEDKTDDEIAQAKASTLALR